MNEIASQERDRNGLDPDERQLTLPAIGQESPPETEPEAEETDYQTRYERLLKEADQLVKSLESAQREIESLHRQHDNVVERLQRREADLLAKLGKTEAGAARDRTDSPHPESVNRIDILERTLARYPFLAHAVVSLALLILFSTAAFRIGLRERLHRQAPLIPKHGLETVSPTPVHIGKPLAEMPTVPASGPALLPLEPAPLDTTPDVPEPASPELPPAPVPATPPETPDATAKPGADTDAESEPAAVSPVLVRQDDAPPWSNLAIENARIVLQDDAWTVTFDFGIFTSMTRMDPDAPETLRLVADALRPHMGEWRLTVSGHCDTVPISPSAPVADNQALSEMRARAVADLFVNEFGFPREAIRTIGQGVDNPPFPNDTPENRARNRTVVLTLTRIAD